jgi:glucokinase
MLLAADIGGTKALVGLFAPPARVARERLAGGAAGARPVPRVQREYATLDFDSLDDLIQTFLDETDAALPDAVAIGVAGPVTGLRARMANVPWLADASAMAERLADRPVALLNDLEAMAWAVPLLEDEELVTLQAGDAIPTGNACLIAAGTGLGEALLHNIEGRFVPSASEGGHADFAARTPRELALVERLRRVHGRVDVEEVVSGPGLVNLFRFTHDTEDLARACRAVGPDVDPADLPAAITASGLTAGCARCAEALEMFVEAYGAQAGNLALRSVATAGVYVGGGIAPRILPAMTDGRFIAAFQDKAPMTDLLRTMPVRVITNAGAGLLGAAVRAAQF